MDDPRGLTPKQVAERLGTRTSHVTALIRSGQLRAADISLQPGGKPRWLIHPEQLESFLRRRTYSVVPKSRRRRNSQPAKKFF
jgi:excisionase family DNA binding protein